MVKEFVCDWACIVIKDMHQARISMSELAEKSGIHRVYLGSVLNSSKPPTPAFRKKVAIAVRELRDERIRELKKQTTPESDDSELI